MDTHIEELFEKAQSFEMGDLMFHPDYVRFSDIVLNVENMMDNCFGGEVARLMDEYIKAYFEVEHFKYLHYFYQGYLAAKAERE